MENQFSLFILLGATGDLAKRKIIPSLYNLYLEKKINKDSFKIIAFGRKDLLESRYNQFIDDSLAYSGYKNINKDFYTLFEYFLGDIDNKESFVKLQNRILEIEDEIKICSNKILYLALTPSKYINVIESISETNLMNTCKDSLTKVVIEKPFGINKSNFLEIDSTLKNAFTEDQIYRVDHYLGKTIFREFLKLNSQLKELLNPVNIDSVFISTVEKKDVVDRATFYDEVGALRDVGQNHLLEIITLIVLQQSKNANIQEERIKIINQLTKGINISNSTFRAQFKGFKDLNGVKENSTTETYFKVAAYLDNKDWKDVKFILEAGKMCGIDRSFIEINYKNKDKFYLNFLRDNQFIKLFSGSNVQEFFRLETSDLQYTDEYSNLILEVLSGNQDFFVDANEAIAQWEFIDPIVEAWKNNQVPLFTYLPNDQSILSVSNI